MTQTDPFFILAECRDLFVSRLADIAQQAGIFNPQVLAAMRREASEVHDELASGTSADGFDQTRGLTASRISLVGNDDLEIDIRIGDIASHLRDDERIDHWRVQLRYMSLLQRQLMSAEQNPLGMEPIRSALWAVCRTSGGNLEQQFDRLDNLEEALKLRLPEVYAELNRLLESKGVRPAPTQLVRQPSSPRAPEAPTSDPLTMLQLTMQQQRGGSFTPAEGAPGMRAGEGGNALLDASALVTLNHLIERMNAIESRQTAGQASPEITTGGSSLPPRPLKSKDLDLAPGQPAAIALDTLALIFEAIFSSPNLPDVVKSLLGRLQIPLLKVAMLDAGFFSDERHPARRLINRLADASLGLPVNVARDHPVCAHLARIVDAAKTTLDESDSDLTPHLARLDRVIGKRDEAIRNAARPLIDLIQQHESRERAQACAEDWLAETLPKVAHPALADLLTRHWSRVMVTAFEDGGKNGGAWKDAESAIEYLLWSIRPKQTSEERQKLTAGIPALLKNINAWFDRIALPQDERKPFLDACFALQTAALRGRAGEDGQPAPASARPAPRTAKPALPRILEADGRQVLYHADPAAPPSRESAGPLAIKIGDWLNYTLPDGKRLSGTCCWLDQRTQTALLFSPANRHAYALPKAAIAAQLNSGQARMLTGTALFDDAAKRALHQLRGG